MSRKSIFELLSDRFDFTTEIKRLDTLFTEGNCILERRSYYNIQDYADNNYFSTWRNRNRCLSCEDMRDQIGIDKICSMVNLTLNEVLIYIEYVINILYLCQLNFKEYEDHYFCDDYNKLCENIDEILNRVNHEVQYFEDKEMALVVEKNPAATAVADIVDDDTAFKVIEYNHYLLKGDLNRKREILIALGDKFEPIKEALKTNGYNPMADDASFMLNNLNIRHNNHDGKNKKEHTASMTKKQIEEWYDKTYDVLLLCLLTNNYISLSANIKALRANY
jgi:hypothetical protein